MPLAQDTRARLVTLAMLGTTLVLGVVSREVPLGVELWDKNLGDALYAVAVMLGLAVLAPRARIAVIAACALGLCTAIEAFQATGIPLALARDHAWVAWILGTEFAWGDLASYAVGIAAITGVSVYARRDEAPRPLARARPPRGLRQ